MKHILTLEQFLIKESTFYRGYTTNTKVQPYIWLSTDYKHAEQYSDINNISYKGDKIVDTINLDITRLNILDLSMYDMDEYISESECEDFLSDVNVYYEYDDLFDMEDEIPLSRLVNHILDDILINIDGLKIMESDIETVCIKNEFVLSTSTSTSSSTINESKKEKRSYGCVMLYFDFPDMSEIQEKIETEDLYDDKGLENEPHCTLLYGLHDDEIKSDKLVFDSVFDVLDTYKYPKKEDKIILTLHNVSLFENDYDVLKFDVKDDSGNNILKKCNKTLCDNFPFTTDFPDYHAHSTVAYLKKGEGKKYVKMFKDLEFKVVAKKIVYSKPDKTKSERKV